TGPAAGDPDRRPGQLEDLRPVDSAGPARPQIDVRPSCDLGGANSDQLDRPIAFGKAVKLVVGAMKGRGQVVLQRHAELERLARITEVRDSLRWKLARLV